MESKINKNKTGLLPRYFKKIGFIVMMSAFVPAVIFKSMNVEMIQSHKELLKVITLNAFLLGLLFVSWSKDKIEDEMTLALRLKSIAWAFWTSIFFLIFKPFVDIFFNDAIGHISGTQIIFFMLVIYLMMYYLLKRGR